MIETEVDGEGVGDEESTVDLDRTFRVLVFFILKVYKLPLPKQPIHPILTRSHTDEPSASRFMVQPFGAEGS